jgi:uncharacterized membrane protein YjdF
MKRSVIATGKVVGIVFNTVVVLVLSASLIASHRHRFTYAAYPIFTLFSIVLTAVSTGVNITNAQEKVKNDTL